MKLKDTVHYQWYKHVGTFAVLAICLYACIRITNANLSEVLSNTKQMQLFLQKLLHPDWSYLPSLITPIIKTIQMSVLSTLLGVLLAIPFSFLATTLITKNTVLTGCIRFVMNIIRTIPNTLLAAILVSIVGIGEVTGVITLTIFTFGLVSQLLYESIETIDTLPIESAESVGANKFKVAVWAVWPQILPAIISYTFYALEINIRSSTVLGYVGAGGIGIILNTSLALFKYDRVSIIILMILILVILVDTISEYARRKCV